MTTFLVSIGIGLSTAAILSLSAVAFTLEYAVSRIANFAHGEFLTIGAYAAYSGQAITHPQPGDLDIIEQPSGELLVEPTPVRGTKGLGTRPTGPLTR